MTQPYPFTYTADTWHAKASAAKRLRSSRLRGHVPKTRQTQEEAVGAISSRFLNRNSQSLAEIARPTLCRAVSRD